MRSEMYGCMLRQNGKQNTESWKKIWNTETNEERRGEEEVKKGEGGRERGEGEKW